MSKNNPFCHVSRCPSCGGIDLLTFEGDKFCLACSWNSIEMSVDRGDLDDLIYDGEEILAKTAALNNSLEDVSLVLDSCEEDAGSAA